MVNNEVNRKKKELRGGVSKLRDEIEPKYMKQFSEIISNKIIDSLYFQQAKNISVYIPSRSEVDISVVIEKAWKLNKIVLAPKTDSSTKQMNFYKITSWDELEVGSFQIQEPVVGKKKPFRIEDIEIILIPGILFDYNGYRIGYGGGYYDRFISQCRPSLYKIGIAFDFQVVKQLPILEHDYAVDNIFTEKQSLLIKDFNKNEIDRC